VSEQKKKEFKIYKDGDYEGKVDWWKVEFNKNDKLTVTIKFKLKDHPEGAFARWYFSPDANEWTSKNLYNCGFRGKTPADLTKENALDRNQELTLVIKTEKFEGNSFSKVVWANKPYVQSYDQADVARMASVDLRAYMAEAKANNPSAKNEVKTPTNEEYSMQADNTFTADDIPF